MNDTLVMLGEIYTVALLWECFALPVFFLIKTQEEIGE